MLFRFEQGTAKRLQHICEPMHRFVVGYRQATVERLVPVQHSQGCIARRQRPSDLLSKRGCEAQERQANNSFTIVTPETKILNRIKTVTNGIKQRIIAA